MTFLKNKPKSKKPLPKNRFAPKPVSRPRTAKENKPEDEVDLKPAFNWFPGHMMKALRELNSNVNLVDVVLEVRDARIPLGSSNQNLIDKISGKTRLILLNKANLSDPIMNEKWSEWFEKQGVPFLFVNCLERTSMKLILSKAKSLVEEKRKSCNEDIKAKEKYKLMIIGLPNTGKSTFINSVANKNAVKVADKPGQTQQNLWVKIDDEMDLLDTPGIMPMEALNDEQKLWLCLINAIPAGITGEEDPAIYLVKHFLKTKSKAFQDRYKLETLDISVDEAFAKIAIVRGCIKQKGLPDLDRIYTLILQDFRSSELGRVTFQNVPCDQFAER